MSFPTRPRPAFAAALVLAAALVAPPARAQSVPAGGRFELTGEFLVQVDGEASPKATLYQSQQARAFLLIAPEFPSPVLIGTASRQVEILDLMKVARQDDVVQLLPQATLSIEGGWELAGDDVVFRAAGKSVRLKPRPWLLGNHSAQEVLDHDPDYQRKAKKYTPISDVIARLKGAKGDVRVLAFFGSWCPHCRENLPSLLRVDQELKASRLRFDYYGVPRPFDKDPEATRLKVPGVPTAVVFVAGREIGRIGGSQWASPETALYDLLKTAGAL